MQVTAELLHIDATETDDQQIIRIARRGARVMIFEAREITPDIDQVEMKLFWANRAADDLIWHADKRQLNLLEEDRAQCGFSCDEAHILADLIVDGLRYREGASEKRLPGAWLFGSHRPNRYIDQMRVAIVADDFVVSGGYRPDIAEEALPVIQSFADSEVPTA